jgi:ABC-2 type transport system permease protein
VVFFSVYALIFGSMSAPGIGTGTAVALALVDEDQSALSRHYADLLAAEPGLRVTRAEPSGAAFDRTRATAAVRAGSYPVAVVLPAGFGAAFGRFDPAAPPADLYYDAANPVARFVVVGMMQALAFKAIPDLLLRRGLADLEARGRLAAGQRAILEQALAEGTSPPTPLLERRGETGPLPLEWGREGVGVEEGVVAVRLQDVRAPEQAVLVAYYAAGISVMFLLFSMAGAGSTLLEAQESGVLERLLDSGVGTTPLLGAGWLFFAGVGTVQVLTMFLWGASFFGINLLPAARLTGVLAMIVTTALAASAFGLMLATLCRTRAQLNGLSTITILLMSALGGSMVPRFIMPRFMDTVGLFTFNGWALDGFRTVLWSDTSQTGLTATLTALSPQVGALTLMTIVFMALGLYLARRWEIV